MKEQFFSVNKKRLRVIGIVYAAAALVIFMGGFLLAQNLSDGLSITLKIIAGLVALFMIITGGSALQKLGDKNAGLTLNKEGITDNATTISLGFIAWKNISKIEINEKEKLILVLVKKPAELISQAKNKAVKQLLKQNMTLYKTPVIIEAKYLSCSFEQLKEAFATKT